MSQERYLRFVKSCHLTLPMPNPFNSSHFTGEEADARSSTPFSQDYTPATPRAGSEESSSRDQVRGRQWPRLSFLLLFATLMSSSSRVARSLAAHGCMAVQECSTPASPHSSGSRGGPAVTAFLIALTAHANNHFILPINSLPNNNQACQGFGLLPYYTT